jgi:ArsR family transcriptional regulator
MDQLSLQFKALGDPLRLRILQLLPDAPRCEDVYNVSELAEELHVAQPTASHHLRILRQAGLVQAEKMCRDVYYWVDRAALEAVSQALLTNVVRTRPADEGSNRKDME